MSAFAKFEVSGPGAEAWLNSILTNKIPKAIGRVTLTYLLTQRGGVRAEFTLTRTRPGALLSRLGRRAGDARFRFAGELLPGDGSVRLDKVTTQYGVLVLAGPRSREVLAKVADIDVSERGVPLADGAAAARSARRGCIAHAGQFRRRARLRAASSDRDAELCVRRADGGRARRSASSRSASARWIR